MKLKFKLSLFNLISKLAVSVLFLIFLPMMVERINLRQIDNDLIRKREQVISLILDIGIEPFIGSDSTDAFGSYNILKEEFVSLERMESPEDINVIYAAARLIDDEEIDYRVLNYSLVIDGYPYLLEVGKSIESIVLARRNISRIITFFIIIIVVVTLIADLQYTGILLAPLDRITAKLKDKNSPGRFDTRPVNTTTSDFLKLDKALSDQMTQIADLFRKERETTVNISHELMTPISIIRSKLENLLSSKDLDNEMASKVSESLKTLHRLQSLVNSLLTIARIESSQYLKQEVIIPGEIIGSIVAELEPVAEDRGIKLESSCPGSYSFGPANRELLFSMFYNVIYNGIKNTGTGGRVLVTGGEEDGKLTVTISDTGRGLSEVQIANLFSRFKSRDGRETDGTGIGLAITRAIADFHGIAISVTSVEGSGTNFFFTFPENS